MGKKKCKQCKEYKLKEEGIQTPAGWFHTFTCATLFAQERAAKAREKAFNKVKKENKKALREFNKRDIPWQHKQTQKSFNRMRVLEELKWFADFGLEPTCISCDKPNMDWCCGHFKTVGGHGRLRYDRKNTYLQCNRHCNMALSGNLSGNKNTRGYRNGLIDRFYDYAADIMSYLEQNTHTKKWEWEELEALRSDCNKKIRELEKELDL